MFGGDRKFSLPGGGRWHKGRVILLRFIFFWNVSLCTGFMCCTKVLDKDGVSAGSIIAEMAAKLATEDKTLTAKLDELYHR